MKGKDIVKIIQDNNLEEFDLKLVIANVNDIGFCVETYSIDSLADIGHSSKTALFDSKIENL